MLAPPDASRNRALAGWQRWMLAPSPASRNRKLLIGWQRWMLASWDASIEIGRYQVGSDGCSRHGMLLEIGRCQVGSGRRVRSGRVAGGRVRRGHGLGLRGPCCGGGLAGTGGRVRGGRAAGRGGRAAKGGASPRENRPTMHRYGHRYMYGFGGKVRCT